MPKHKSPFCSECGKDISKSCKVYPNNTCQGCYKYFKSGGKINPIPNKGEIKLDPQGRVICHICGRSYRKLGAHIKESHNMTRRRYSEMFELDIHSGICSEEHSNQLRKLCAKHSDVVVVKNLIQKGAGTRFKKGDAGRTKDKISTQTLNRLRGNLKKT